MCLEKPNRETYQGEGISFTSGSDHSPPSLDVSQDCDRALRIKGLVTPDETRGRTWTEEARVAVMEGINRRGFGDWKVINSDNEYILRNQTKYQIRIRGFGQRSKTTVHRSRSTFFRIAPEDWNAKELSIEMSYIIRMDIFPEMRKSVPVQGDSSPRQRHHAQGRQIQYYRLVGVAQDEVHQE